MLFYPVIYTRTCFRNLEKNREGFGFYMRTSPPSLPNELRELVNQIINEDHFPKMTQPRRLFWRTDRFIFWGVGMHNEWFLPQETMETLDMETTEKKLRGFWGGYIEIPQDSEDSLLPLILSSLLERPGGDCALPEGLRMQSEHQPRAESDDGDTSYPPMEFVGRSSYCFPARLFQHFVQQHWTNSYCPVKKEERRQPNWPIISQIPYDLRFFTPETEISHATEMPSSIQVREGYIQLLPPMPTEEEANFWKDLIFSKQNICVVSALSEQNHVVRFPSLQVAIMQGTPQSDYVKSVTSIQVDSSPEESEGVCEDEKCRVCLFKRFFEAFPWIYKLFRRWLCGSSQEKSQGAGRQGNSRSAPENSPTELDSFDPFARRKNGGSIRDDSSRINRNKKGMFDDLEE
ncbi:MAG: hypothetical protein Q4D38_12100 [Planctomycetia bacterium]|nr:hypothetical protein [Planctomycetia bacterium]